MNITKSSQYTIVLLLTYFPLALMAQGGAGGAGGAGMGSFFALILFGSIAVFMIPVILINLLTVFGKTNRTVCNIGVSLSVPPLLVFLFISILAITDPQEIPSIPLFVLGLVLSFGSIIHLQYRKEHPVVRPTNINGNVLDN